MPLLALGPPRHIDGSVLVLDEVPPPSVEDSSGQSFHTQHERLLPTPSSRAVTMNRLTRKEIPAATALPIRTDRRLADVGERGENLENPALNLLRMLCQERRARKPPGSFVTASGTFATVAGAR